ncbi:MAG: carboxylesterase family protein [Proteobacteria bacterium]|nr:carboxylesterase family protein [Pseudomonadota bacterium]
MRKFILAAPLLTFAATGGVQAQVVLTRTGPVAGETQAGVSAFKGIPYAAPPVGANRWQPPQPVLPWKAVRDGSAYGHDCAQAPFPPDAAPIRTVPSEDCLYLNVWKPAAAKAGAGMPVMVWIHGGGFVNGGTSPAVYSGINFARDGVVLVSINYRLGRFGFFAHPAFAAEGFGGNFGFLDQIAALKWVQANISAFGGDPHRVTVFGESAGGVSVHMLLQSPLARRLFNGAIIESGGGRERLQITPTVAQAARAGEAFAPSLTAAQLRALPAEKVTGDLSLSTMGQASYSGPMIDGRTVYAQAVDAIAGGLYASVPVMVGANSADGFPFTTDKAKMFSAFGNSAAQARHLYDPDGTGSAVLIGTQTVADQIFIEPARAVARGLAARGGTVYLYRFAHNGLKSGVEMGGAPHASEIPYVFDLANERPEQLDTGKEEQVAALTHRYWINFAKTGRPDGAGDVPAWPRVTVSDRAVQFIDAEGAGHREDPLTARLDLTERQIAPGR